MALWEIEMMLLQICIQEFDIDGKSFIFFPSLGLVVGCFLFLLDVFKFLKSFISQ